MLVKKYYVGLDVGLSKSCVCVVDAFGEVLFEAELASDGDLISKKLSKFPQDDCLIGLETGQISIHLTKVLRDLGWHVVCMDARQVATALSTTINKTDKNDARGISHLLRCQLYKEVHIKSDSACDIRVILASRKQIVEQIGRLESSMRGLFKIYGVKLGTSKRKSFIEQAIEQAEKLGDSAKTGILAMISSLKTMYQELAIIDKKLKENAKNDKKSANLITIPGVGPITAFSFIAAIDDEERFKTSRAVGAYMGLTPRQYSSGETQKQGRVSKCGPTYCRAMLFEAAHCLMHFYKKKSKLKNWAKKLAKKKGTKKAIVALARKLAVIMHKMLITETPYNEAKLNMKG